MGRDPPVDYVPATLLRRSSSTTSLHMSSIFPIRSRRPILRNPRDVCNVMLATFSGNIIALERSEVKDDLVQDMIEVLTSFCARLYGRRSARTKTEKAMQAIGR